MAQYIRAVRVTKDAGGAQLQTGQAPGYLDKVKAFIPTQAVTAYAVLVGYNQFNSVGQKLTFYIIAAAVCVIYAGVLIYRQGTGDPISPRIIQALISMVAFVVWAYAVNEGVVREKDWYHAAYAGLALVVFTAAFGAYTPKVEV